MKRRLPALISVILVIVMCLGACSGGQTPASSAAASSAASSAAASEAPAESAAEAEGEPMTVSVMFFDHGVPDGIAHPNTGETSVVVTELYPELFARTPNVTWEFEALQGDTEGYNSYLLRGASGTLPDISMLDGYWVAAFASQDYTVPMEEVLTKEQLDLYYPQFRNTYAGKTHGLVMSTAFNGVLWYRESHMAEKGLTMPPKSWDELRDFAKQLTIPGERYGLVMPLAKTEHTTVCLLGYYWGGQVPFVDSNNVAQFNNKTSIDLFNLLKGMYDDKSMPEETLTMMYDDAERLFDTGMASMLQHGAWLSTGWETRAPDFADDIGVAPLPPHPDTGVSSQNAGGWGLSVTTTDPAKYSAINEFVSIMTLEPEWVTKRLAEYGEIPVTNNISSGDVTWFPEKYSGIIMDMLPTSNTRPIVEVYPDASLEYTQAMQEAVTGTKDAETALKDATDRVASIAKESGWGQ